MIKLNSNSEFEISKKFSEKIFSSKDIKDLIIFFNRSYNEIEEEDTKLKLYIKYEDGTSIQGSDENVLNDTKEIKLISFSLSNDKNNKNIKVLINKYDGEYTIASYNEDWVRAKESTFEDYLQAVNNQNKFFSQSIYQSIIQNGLMIILGTSIYYFLFRTLFPESIRAENISFLALLILSYLIAGIISYILSQKFFDLYPKIEFDTTRNHLNTKKKTRNRLITFLSIILIPFIIGIISNSIF